MLPTASPVLCASLLALTPFFAPAQDGSPLHVSTPEPRSEVAVQADDTVLLESLGADSAPSRENWHALFDAADIGAEWPDATELSRGDYLFPRKGRALVTALSGIPYVGIAEFAYGFTDRFSVGVWAGVIPPKIPGFGLRARYLIAQPSRDFRVHIKLPLVYYPKTQGLAPWYLAWPAVNAEWRRENGTRWWTGMGLVGTTGGKPVGRITVDPVAATAPPRSSRYGNYGSASPVSTALATSPGYKREGIHNGYWNTIQFGFSKPIGRRFAFQLEAAVVLRGARLAGDEWVGGLPVILTTGFSRSF